MKTEVPFDYTTRSGGIKDFDAELAAVFSKTSAISLCLLDSQYRFQFVNNAVVAMHNGIPGAAFIGRTLREMIGDAAPGPEARLQRIAILGETPAVEISLMLPHRTEPGYWVEKNFAIKRTSGRVTQIASLAIEVTTQRRLEQYFRNLGSEQLSKNNEYQRLARELQQAINRYHAALARNLDDLSRCARDPEKLPELLQQSQDSLDEHIRTLASVVARCFPVGQQH